MIIKDLETCQSDLKYIKTQWNRGFVSKLEELIYEFKQQNGFPVNIIIQY